MTGDGPLTGDGRTVSLGLLLPTDDPPTGPGGFDVRRHVVDLARRAVAAGFTSVWAGEALQRARLEPLAVLATVAGVTGDARLGTAALNPVYRQPVATAQQVASLDRLTGGRLVLGVGAGWPSPATQAAMAIAGVDPRRRVARLDDIAALWRAMWRRGATTFDGATLRLRQLPPAAAHTADGPPLWLASDTAAAHERVGRLYDGWLPYPPAAGDYATGWARIAASASVAGRPVAAIAPGLFATVVIDDDAERAERQLDAFCRASYGFGADAVRTIQVMATGPASAVVADLRRHVAAGARHVVVRLAVTDPYDQVTQLERVVDALLPAARLVAPPVERVARPPRVARAP